MPDHIRAVERHADSQRLAAHVLRSAESGTISPEKLDSDAPVIADLLHESEPLVARDFHHAKVSGEPEETARTHRLLTAHRALLDRVREAVA